jgi:HAE1 family hydrophobic/amphiphilic exporter-1
VTGGTLGQQPAPADNAFQLTVTTQGRFEDPRQFRQVIVRSTPDGRLVRVQDVARVEYGAQDYTTNSYLDGKPAVGMGVFQRPGTNAIAAAQQVIGRWRA